MNRFDYAPRYDERQLAEDSFLAERRLKDRENWTDATGDYSLPFSVDQQVDLTDRSDITELRGSEKTLFNAMKKIIQRRKSENISGPAVFLDFGGMWGTTWMRLAHQFEDEIARGEVCFVVTNLHLDPNKQDINQETLPDETKAVVQKFGHLVHFVQANAEELANFPPLKLPNGKEILVQNHITLIHELNTIKHSKIPDVVLPTLGKYLEPGGVFLFGSHRTDDAPLLADEMTQAVNAAFQFGEENLSNMGLIKLGIPKNRSNYLAFSSRADSAQLFRP
ncbi:hypothetical protein C4579_00595 [Candidatus Microgenomates bacterium]|nr:MAG: hypothetical protein C4579_00595 [Candidatus Microgenomates bacterium]